MKRLNLAAALLAFGFAHQPLEARDAPACSDHLAAAFADDPQANLVLTRQFRKGEKLVLPGDNPAMAPVLANDVCLVKLNVGPGNPGPAGAPSTTRGIGIEIWLPMPERWNGRIHALGGGGYQGGASGSAQNVGNPYAAAIADSEGAVSSTNDAGHASVPHLYGIPDSGGDFLLNPDGSIPENLWRDYSVRALHEQAAKTKAVTRAFFGRPAHHAYWDGSSTGGRQGHKLAQVHPDDFDGIIANLPALHFTQMLPAMGWPQLVYQRDLEGKPLSVGQQDLVSNAAIAACDMQGGKHLGYIPDPGQCRYDPVKDRTVQCVSDGGSNTGPDCITRQQARVFNKIWYGPTSDGSVPDPARDNGWNSPPRGKHLWYGMARGTSLWAAFFTTMMRRPSGVANPEKGNLLGNHQLALQMQNPKIAEPGFRNTLGNGEDGWKQLTYRQFAAAMRRGRTLNAREFAGVDTDNPDLSAFEASGGKLLFWHGTNDEVIPLQGSIQYYNSVVRKLGGLARVQNFYRFYVVPGAGHQSPNGTANPAATPPTFTREGLYERLVAWVERSEVPGRIDLASPGGERSAPVCPYPQKALWQGGDPYVVASYRCE